MPRQFGVPQDLIDKIHNGEAHPREYSPFFSPIHGKHVIGVNAAFLLGIWVDMMFFGDSGFYRTNRKEIILNFNKLHISCSPRLKDDYKSERLKYIPRNNKKLYGITTKKDMVSWNKSTGACAINLAYHLGAKRIILLGFDMDLYENNRHWHKLYSYKHPSRKPKQGVRGTLKTPFHRHLEAFPHIRKDADKLGIEILNVSPLSKIEAFKKVELKDVL